MHSKVSTCPGFCPANSCGHVCFYSCRFVLQTASNAPINQNRAATNEHKGANVSPVGAALMAVGAVTGACTLALLGWYIVKRKRDQTANKALHRQNSGPDKRKKKNRGTCYGNLITERGVCPCITTNMDKIVSCLCFNCMIHR
jgi:hypothetical protein